MEYARYSHTATLLSNNKVLVVGGATVSTKLNTAELYDPADGSWTRTAHDLTDARYYHTATLLTYVGHQESVLVVGGQGNSGVLGSAELYDPAVDTWTPTNSLTYLRRDYVASQMLNGKVIVIGGVDGSGTKLNSTEIYDPTTPTSPPDVPVTISPNGDTNLQPSYVWNYSSGATSYQITVYNVTTSTTLYNNVSVSTSFCTGGICTYHPFAELDTGDYQFKVRASNVYASSEYSDWRDFHVLGNNHIIGSAGVSGVTLTYFDVKLKSTSSDSEGNYSATVSYNWTGTITPSKPGYTFDPEDLTFEDPVTENQTGADFIATRIPFTIQGNAAGLSDVTLSYTLDGVPTTTTTDGSGAYTATVYWGWTGKIAPFKLGYIFSPVSRSYSNVTNNMITQNYTAVAGISTFLPLIIRP